MSYKKIPPVKSIGNKANFVQNFFWRLADMKIMSSSKQIETFLDDSNFKSMMKLDQKSADLMVNLTDA